MFYNFRKNKKAFTLVELIVVIAIIAILGAVVGVTVATFVDRARKTAATTPLSELASKWELKEDNQTLQQYLQSLFPDDCQHFQLLNNNRGQLTLANGKLTGTYYIYYNDDNCGDWWGRLYVVNGAISKQSTVDAVDGAPTGTLYACPEKT